MRHSVSKVTSKGQLVIPSKLRKKLGIRKGTQVAFIEEGKRLVIQPITPDYVRSLRGSLKGTASALRVILQDHKKDRKL
jgi:AbrB family looped-hinge helix DNA binding protein